jgi:hypothetical protein
MNERTKKDAKAIVDLLNNMSFKEEEVGKAIAHDHRTIQQKFMRLCISFIYEQAEKEHSDPRNEATVKHAKNIAKLLKEENAYFPYI